MKIAHLADIQIRFGSRHKEYRHVFDNLYEDLSEQQPDRIVIAGDLCHHKIQISPNSLELTAEFLTNLSKIAPVDVIPGNHDLNIKHLEQGDTIRSILNIVPNGVLVNEEDEIDFDQKAIYYFKDSGFYDLNNGIVYGIYSFVDGEVLELKEEDKEEGKSYIAIYHGTIWGSVMDNLYQMKDDEDLRIDTFQNFDIVMLGDIHEYQTFDLWEYEEIDATELQNYEKQDWEKYGL